MPCKEEEEDEVNRSTFGEGKSTNKRAKKQNLFEDLIKGKCKHSFFKGVKKEGYPQSE